MNNHEFEKNRNLSGVSYCEEEKLLNKKEDEISRDTVPFRENLSLPGGDLVCAGVGVSP
jgi:hypothetical protein